MEMSKIYMTKCPKCGKENYAMAVASGQCSWCSYKATKEDVGKRGVWTEKK
jgi:ribosomal protein L37E